MRHRETAMMKAAMLLGCLMLLALPACTHHARVPLAAAPCAVDCADAESSCKGDCARTGQVELLEGVRRNLCEKDCVHAYEQCMLRCPGVQ